MAITSQAKPVTFVSSSLWEQSGLPFRETSRPLPTFLIVQHGSLFSAGFGGEYSAKNRWMPDYSRRAWRLGGVGVGCLGHRSFARAQADNAEQIDSRWLLAGMTVNEKLCRIHLVPGIFLRGVGYAYALHPGCGAPLFQFCLGRDGLRREVWARLQYL